ncbi:ABC transporter permease, partial [Rhodococcus qingshengii]
AGAALGIVLLGVFGVGLGALSYALALAVREQDWMFWVVQQTLMFPLLILSGTMLPLEDAPGWMKVLVNINPLGYVVDAERALFAGDFASSSVLAGIVAALGVAVVGLGVGVRAVK